MYALNLNHSPERSVFWGTPIPSGWAQAKRAVRKRRVPSRTPGVSDSIELSNGGGVTRRVGWFLRGNPRVWRTDMKGGALDD